MSRVVGIVKGKNKQGVNYVTFHLEVPCVGYNGAIAEGFQTEFFYINDFENIAYKNLVDINDVQLGDDISIYYSGSRSRKVSLIAKYN